MAEADSQTGSTPPAGFTAFDGHYYKYVKGLFSVYEARTAAMAAGGHLATVGSAAENDFLAGLIAGQDLGAWLGGSDAATEGVWRWTEGPEAGQVFWNGLSGGSAPDGAFTGWSVGEPNGIWNGIEEDHVHMMANSDKWNDASGQWATMGYFIEIGDADVPPPPPVNAAPVITSNGGGSASAVSVAENATAVTTVTASDPEGDTPGFALAGGADELLFTIDAASGALSFVTAPDFETPTDAGADNVYDVIVRVTATGGEDTQALAIAVTDVTEAPVGGTPPAGFTAFDGHYYKYVKGLFSVYEARTAAMAAGGHLATVGSAAENDFLAGLIAGQDLGAWLGGSDAATEGVWRWTEGPEAGQVFWNGLSGGSAPDGAFTGWSVGEPNGIWNGIEEDHVHMMANSDKWNDASGQWATMGYFIEIGDADVPPPPPVNAAPVITSNGGGSASAVSVAENATAVTTVTASDPEGDTPGFALAGGADELLFTIDAASGALSFVTAPDFETPTDAGADNVYDVIVRVTATGGEDTQALAIAVTDVTEAPVGGTPPAGFTAFDGHYYKYVKGLFSVYEARTAAMAAGGHLATVGSAAENDFLAGLIAGQDLGAWLGGSDAATEGVWRWTEGPEAGQVFWNGLSGGSAPDGAFTGWSVGEPNGIWNGIEEDHVHMMANSDKWNDASGQWATMGYFIEIGDADVPPPPPVNAAPVITSNGGGSASAVSVAENATAVTTVTASDPEGDTPGFALAGGADELLFTIDAASGALSFVTAPDFETPTDAGADNVYDVIVRVTATGGEDTQALAIAVTDVTEAPVGGTPPAGFTAFDGHYYKYVKGDFTQSQASDGAQSEGGYLATITSAAENAFLADLMARGNPGGYGGWLGGGDAAEEGVWRWTEGPEAGQVFWNGLSGGSAPDGAFTRWLPGEPSQYKGTQEDHLHMLSGTDQWNDIPDSYWLTMGYFVEIGS